MFSCASSHPIAIDSNDHLYPRATKNDNHANRRFNEKLIKLIGEPVISVLDLGCAGGGMVKTFLDMGHVAVGIDGSDYNLNTKRAAWGVYPDNLFTADATKPFVLSAFGVPYKFDAVTAWEFFEHIKEPDLQGVIDNILTHLKDDGWLIASIASTQVRFSEVGNDKIYYHHTIKPASWWQEHFGRAGLRHKPEMLEYFDGAWVRSGPIKITAQKVKQ